jgi:hypothetical protein
MYGLVRNTTSERKEELVKPILVLYIAFGFFRVKEVIEDNPKRKRTSVSRSNRSIYYTDYTLQAIYFL